MDAFKFDQLPDLCLRKIFAFLGLRDLAKCRAVNRQFKLYADQTNVTELVVLDPERYNPFHRDLGNWYLTDKPIDFANSITPNAFASAKSSFKLDQQLKFLYIRPSETFDLKILSDLSQLTHLEFDIRDSAKRTLVLPNLKVLHLYCRWPTSVLNSNFKLWSLKTPKLEVLLCERMRKFRLKHPETIKQVECLDFGANYDELTKLSNLAVLHTSLGVDELDKVPDYLSNLKTLKELHLTVQFIRFFEYNRDNVKLRSSLAKIVHERSALKRDDLKISLNDLLLLDEDRLPVFEAWLIKPETEVKYEMEISDYSDVETCFVLMNYRLLRYDTAPNVNKLNFGKLAELDFEISEDFFDRFPQIRTITAERQIDREQFEWFLQNVTALRTLKLTETALDQQFMNRLPKLCPRLTGLKVHDSLGLVTDFHFLLQFEQLKAFETDRPFHSLDLAATAFQRSAKLESLRFRTGNEFVKIHRLTATKDHYGLWFFERNQPASVSFSRQNLSWSELTALCHSRRASLAASENRMKIKRIRLV